MKIFKSDELKRELKRFEEQDLIKILECSYCQKTACQSFHTKFLVSRKFCRESFCNNCHKFDVGWDVLLRKADEIRKDYIENFIRDFFNISTKTIKLNYKVQIESVPVEKTFKVKSYNKSEKNRIQVINKEFKNCEKISYSFKGKQRTFIKNFIFVFRS